MPMYILKRLLLIVPTLFGIITLNFFIVQLAPGGPVDQMLAQMSGETVTASDRIGGVAAEQAPAEANSQYPGADGVDPALIAALEKQFGFDKPLHERYFNMLWDYARSILARATTKTARSSVSSSRVFPCLFHWGCGRCCSLI